MLRSLSRSGGALRRAATLAARRSLPSAAARPSAVAVTPADSGVRLDVHGNNHLEARGGEGVA